MTELICIVCPKGCHLKVDEENGFLVSGNTCPRGEEYGKNELQNPTRVLTSTACISGAIHPRLPVKTAGAIPKRLVFPAMEAVQRLRLNAPVRRGDILIRDICGSGINLVAARDMDAV